MEFEKLIADFAERHNVADLTVKDGITALSIDDILVSIVSSGNMLILSAELGERPAEGAAEFAELLLEANLLNQAFFAKNPDAENYIVVRRLPLPLLDGEAFDVALEAFVNQVEEWRRLLADFRPAAEASAERSEAEEATSYDSNDFLRV